MFTASKAPSGGLLPIALTNELPLGAKVLYIMFGCNVCHFIGMINKPDRGETYPKRAGSTRGYKGDRESTDPSSTGPGTDGRLGPTGSGADLNASGYRERPGLLRDFARVAQESARERSLTATELTTEAASESAAGGVESNRGVGSLL